MPIHTAVAPPCPAPAAPRGNILARAALGDVLLSAMLAVAFFLLAANLQLAEKLAAWVADYEHWQLDELPLSLLLLSAGLAWLSFRRGRLARRAQAEIQDLLEQNRGLTQRLIQAQEDERCALARELHDEVGQNCTAIRAEASYIARAGLADRAAVIACARRIGLASENLHALVRQMLQRLRPPALDSLGLEPALQTLCESWEQQCGIACHFFPQDIPCQLDDATSVTLFRLVQESLTNVARHAGADQVRIDLHPGTDGRTLELHIEDNGRGMPAAAGRQTGFGIAGMRERVAGLRGNIQWISSLGRGLRIEVALPAVRAAA